MNQLKNLLKRIDGSVFIIVLSAGCFFWTFTSSGQSEELEAFPTSQWVVSEGESLWSIAAGNRLGKDMSIEEMVYWMKEHNNLGNETIYPGQKIEVPVTMVYASN
ncbi:MAG: LysM peptidoglycan-binding domain-containing protein [Bacillus sp. (in: Bacteria)]|nr:LysM peptidoglycan-binding domain-containing protein [Bacillus sp. (in: firmicutes)]